MNQTEKKVLKKITPTDEYKKKISEIIKELEIILKKEIKNRNIDADILLVGSIAKDTYLMNNMDIDFFICFSTDYTKDEIAKKSLAIGKKILSDTEESYAEHPYIRGYYKEEYIEIVPCYKIEKASQKLTAVDRTPLHTEFVIKNLKEKQKEDVRLFKQFLKGINCYGAEAQIQGFSGYLCEIMIIYYNDFSNLIKNVKNLKYNQKFSLLDKDIPEFDSPIVFIDPVDKDRNVASALSKEKFKLFKIASKKYLEKPSIRFFFPKKINPWSKEEIKKEINKQDFRYIGIKIDEPDIIDENLYPQIRKALKSIKKNANKNDFEIFDTKFHIDKEKKNIYLIIKTHKKNLSKTKIHIGPPLKLKENTKEFENKWKNNDRIVKKPYIEDNRLKVEIKRKYIDIRTFLKNELLELSLGKHLGKEFKKNYKIIENHELIKDNLREFWTEYFEEKYPWERT